MAGRHEVELAKTPAVVACLDEVGEPSPVVVEPERMVRTAETAGVWATRIQFLYQHYPHRNPHEVGARGVTGASTRLKELECDD